MSLCHDVELNVEIVMARSRERGEMSKLHALEPRALIPRAQANKQKKKERQTINGIYWMEADRTTLGYRLKILL